MTRDPETGIADSCAERPAVLLIEHGLGGGVEKHVLELAELLHDRADFLRLRPNRGGLLEVSRWHKEFSPTLYFRAPQEIPALVGFLRASAVSRIHFHNTLRLDARLMELPQALGVPYDFTVHDYYCFCPQITLTTESFGYCGEPDESGCNQCLQIRPAPTKESIERWRSRFREFVQGAERVFAPSPGVELQMGRHFPNAEVVLAPHPEPVEVASLPEPIWRYRTGNLKIVVLGALSAIKGADLLEACAIDAAQRHLPLEFHLVGYAYRNLSRAENRLIVHGKYHDNDLHRLLQGLSSQLAWFPSRGPETYSFTLSAALREGLPVAATKLGAIPDRLAGRALSWTLPWNTKAREWNEFFLKLRSSTPAWEGQRIPARNDQSAQFSYLRDYLPKQPASVIRSEVESNFDAYRSPLRANPKVLAQYMRGYARLWLSAAYRLPGFRRIATTFFPEYRLQLLRRWLDKY